MQGHPISESGNERGRGRNTEDAVKAAAPAVVKVMRTNGTSGSGFVISEDGWVVTNEHVIAKAEGEIITISFENGDGEKFVAKVHSFDIHTDVAMLQVETRGMKVPVAYMAKSSTLQHGEDVLTIGSPHGLENTVRKGIVSNLSREMKNKNKAWRRYIQTDAGISPGNSGGPLVNLDGEVVGINTFIICDIRTDAGTYVSTGLGFALPIDSAFDKLGPEIKEAVARNKAENMAKKAEKARVENARAETARVADENSELAQAAAKEKFEQEFAQLRAEIAAAARKIEEAEAARQEKEAAAEREAEVKAARKKEERMEEQRAEIRAAENRRNPFIELYKRENFIDWAAVPAAYGD